MNKSARTVGFWGVVGVSAFMLAAATVQYSLAEAHSRGLKAYDQREFADALRWLWLPAWTGNDTAQALVGSMYAMGLGTTRDGDRATYWLERAASSGLIQAQMMLGTLYATGAGVPFDREKARYWLTRAANGGDYEAAALLRRLQTPSTM
jgi:hypothetical protein